MPKEIYLKTRISMSRIIRMTTIAYPLHPRALQHVSTNPPITAANLPLLLPGATPYLQRIPTNPWHQIDLTMTVPRAITLPSTCGVLQSSRAARRGLQTELLMQKKYAFEQLWQKLRLEARIILRKEH
jgi:hypothetical protein